jgi:two-component system LytT family response regulator
MIDCVVVNNEESIELIQQLVVGYPFFNILKFFTNSIEAARYIRRNKVDLLLLNTDLGNIDGFEYYQSFSEDIKVVYTSNQKELAVKAFDVDAIDYLMYPFSERRFLQMLQKAKTVFTLKLNSKQNEERFIQIRADYATLNVDLREIQFIEAFGDYLKIHLIGKKPIVSLMTLKSITDKLPDEGFVRIHRSYIVNLKFIESVKGKRINIGVTELPLSKSFEKDFFQIYVKEIV